MAPAVLIGHIGEMDCANAHDGHINMHLIQTRCHSTTASSGKNVQSNRLNNRAIFVRVETLYVTPQRRRSLRVVSRHQQPDQSETFHLRDGDIRCSRGRSRAVALASYLSRRPCATGLGRSQLPIALRLLEGQYPTQAELFATTLP